METNNLTDYIIKRKRNILTFVLLIILIKLIVHFFIYPIQEGTVNYDKEIIHESFSTYYLRNKENIFTKDSLGFLEKYTGSQGNFANIISGYGTLFTKNGEEIRMKRKDFAFYYPKEYRSADFATHLQNLFKDKLWIFGMLFGIMLLLVFLFNDKIKAR